MAIDKRGGPPSYQQLAAILRAKITSGEYGPDDKLPSIRQLCQDYDLADGTVQKAIDLLVDEGLVVAVSGRGTFVC
jgi:GntR family transcriptional regulator